jgi:hypothetical protein
MTELVVSLYNRDLGWLSNVDSSVKKTIYRKGSLVTHPDEVFLQNNVGRDVHTFFHHIVSNYSNLSEYTFFSQDFPFDHVQNYIELINGNRLKWDMEATHTFGGYWGFYKSNNLPHILEESEQFGGKVLKCTTDGSPHHNGLNLGQAWEFFFDVEIPLHFEFTPGGHFCISKEQVHTRPLDFYKKIVLFLETNEHAPWIVERLEPYIFNLDTKIK